MNTATNKKRKVLRIALIVWLCVSIALCLLSFAHFYKALNISLRDERAIYVNEITGQLTRSITAKREWLISRIGSSASSLNQSGVASFAQARRLFANKSKENYTVLLADAGGSTYTLDGKTAQIRNFDILSATLNNKGAQYHFDKSADGVDYWVFSCAVEPRVVDGVAIVAIYEIYDVEQFHDDLYLGLFGDNGYTYIVDLDGGVQLGPKIDVDFIGYNLISSLRNAGIDSAVADKIESDIRQKQGDSLFAGFNGTDWAVQYEPLTDSGEMAVVIAPIATTSRETTDALQYTLLSIVGVVCGLALLIIVIIIIYASLAKERNRQMYDLELKNRVASTKNNFLAKMSHDIRTPLNAIIGMNYIANQQVADDAPVKDCFRQIDVSAKYLLGILNDILDMSKIESGKMELRNEAFDAKEVLDAVEAISRKQALEKNVGFTLAFDKSLSRYYIGDKQRLAQILMNLTNNAVKYTPCGGSIDVGLTLLDRNDAMDTIRLLVRDNGVGIAPEYMENLFVPFTQDLTNAVNPMGGSGLGLSIVKSFVDMMGGTIAVQSEKGEGSVFTVELTLERALRDDVVHEATEATFDERALTGKRVLLVEDNEINQIVATKIISGFHLKVETAENGVKALETFLASKENYYDIIITDIQMPEMDGYELADRIRALKRPDARAIPILAMSANAFDDDIQKSLEHGMNAHLKKPVEVPELKSALCKYLGGGDHA